MDLAIVLRGSASLVIYCVPGRYRAQEAKTSRDLKAITGEGVAHRKHSMWPAMVTAEGSSHIGFSGTV